jgi:integrase
MIRRKGRAGYWFLRQIDGRRRCISLGSHFDEAKAKLRQLQARDTLGSDVPLREAADRWLATYVPTARNEKGQDLAKKRVERYLKPGLGHFVLRKLSGDRIREYRLWLEKQELNGQTVTHVLSDLRCLLRWSEDCGLIERTSFPRRVMPRIQERPPDRLPAGAADVLVCLSEPYGFTCRLLLGTGLRWAEACRAQATDLERGCLVVHQTKSGRVRRIPLEPELLSEVQGRVGRLVPFSTESPGSFSRTIRSHADLDDFHAHQLRHEFACRWLEKGRSLAALQVVLGHASIVTTQRYARLSDEAVLREVQVSTKVSTANT